MPRSPQTIDGGRRPAIGAVAGPADARERERLDHLLEVSSRTFALTIPLLPDPTRREVTLAYLLFRVADTLEDATRWPRARKLEELRVFADLVGDPGSAAAGGTAAAVARRWSDDPPLEHAGYLELLEALAEVLRATAELPPRPLEVIRRHTLRTIDGMASFVARGENGALRLDDLDDLRAYCYAVAGIVGEMLTEIFLIDHPRLGPVASELRRDAATFGEALQLVNILKDSSADSTEGRHYLPGGVSRESVFVLARADLAVAAAYCGRLENAGAPGGLVGFTALPVLLACASLRAIASGGPGSKISRSDVSRILAALHEAVSRRGVSELLKGL